MVPADDADADEDDKEEQEDEDVAVEVNRMWWDRWNDIGSIDW